jgi:GNAT superfamily N-acetyltransferase
MLRPPVRLRRGRRTDFVAVMAVLAASGVPTPPPDRATLRRFRRVVADLGTDLYLAVVAEHVVGFVHVSYTRQLTVGAVARLELLCVTPDARARGVGRTLLDHAVERARRRGCSELCSGTDLDEATAGFLTHAGWNRRSLRLSHPLAT